MAILYSLTATIDAFFRQTDVSQGDCDELAQSLVGGPVEPVPIQGEFSYTVIAGPVSPKVVQFRAQKSALELETLKLARSVHPHFVTACDYHGTIGSSSPLSVYVMDKIPGIAYIQFRGANHVATDMSIYTVTDLARFFAESWIHRQPKSPSVLEAIHCDFAQRLDVLSRSLPARFADALKQTNSGLALLFTPSYPLALTHGDLCEMNILVDPNSGHISGIIDWAEAKILPFGTSLWGLENTLGFMDSAGWHYYDNHHDLEALFWRTFYGTAGEISETDKHAIQVARIMGLFLRYGFVWEDGVRERPARENDSRLRYLDAFLAPSTS